MSKDGLTDRYKLLRQEYDNKGRAMSSDYKIETLSLHAGQTPDERHGSRAVPIHQTTSYVFKSTEHAASLFNLEVGGHIYSRLTNPTVAVLEQRVAAMDGGVAAVFVPARCYSPNSQIGELYFAQGMGALCRPRGSRRGSRFHAAVCSLSPTSLLVHACAITVGVRFNLLNMTRQSRNIPIENRLPAVDGRSVGARRVVGPAEARPNTRPQQQLR